MTAELRRGVLLGLLGLLLGLGLVAAWFGGFDRGKPAEPAPGAVGALTPPGGGTAVPEAPKPAAPAPRTEAPEAPKFDIVRVEPNGEAVVAGRGAPNTVVDLLVDGKPVARALADPNGQFAIVPPALKAGNSEIVLRSTNAEGRETRSTDSVAVAVSPSRTEKPLVALTSPDKPTVVLSQPDAPAPRNPQVAAGNAAAPGAEAAGTSASPGGTSKGGAGQDGAGRMAASDPAGKTADRAPPPQDAAAKPARTDAPAPVKIVSVDAQEGGRLFVTGRAPPGATVRLYLNDTLIAPASVGPDGTVTFTIGRGVKPGAYTVRVDQVDSVSGKVRSRAEVPFTVPEPARVAASKPGEIKPAAPAAREAAAPTGSAPAAGAMAQVPAAPSSPKPAAPAPKVAEGSLPAPRPPAPAGGAPSAVFVAEVNTAKIIRGDNLWQISRRTYGTGDRYTVIYDANQEQIRNPDLIYPGQIFVLPADGRDSAKVGKNG